MSDDYTTIERRVFMGIGDAVLRLIHVERMYADGVDPAPQLVAERNLIVQALNQQYQLDLGMDCDLDGIPDAIDDDVQVLTHAAQTSCCRIRPDQGASGSRVEALPDPTPFSDASETVKVEKSSPSRKKTTSPGSRKATTKKAPAKKATTKKATTKKAPAKKAPAKKAPAKSAAPKRGSRKKSEPKATPKATPSTKKTSSNKSGGFFSSLFGSDQEK